MTWRLSHMFEIQKKSYVDHPHHSISHPSWRTFQLKWYIIMSATSLVLFSLLSLQSTVPSTTKPHEHRLGNWGIRKMDFQRTFKCFSLVLCGLGRIKKSQTRKNPPLAALHHSGASCKAVIVRSLAFEQIQIEGRSWWQITPILRALQLCCCVPDWKTISLGSRPANIKM